MTNIIVLALLNRLLLNSLQRTTLFSRMVLLASVVGPGIANGADSGSARSQRLPDRVTFNAHIRPIMSNTCFACHGPDQKQNDSGFRLDSFAAAASPLPSDDALVGIKPGDPASSEVYRRIAGLSDGEQMPPADFRHQLSEYDKRLFRRWIEQGGDYEEHWAFAPLKRPPVPQLDAPFDQPGNPIDAFVLARLAREGIAPSELADKATLLRRLSLDLVGLPPTPAELRSFLADQDEDAYAEQVERLLESPHFGERMAVHWLDLVRFADTVGFHGDQNQRIFPYRDYVIEAFNNNKPFDQFTREQIAGDLLPGRTAEQLVATGMLRLNMMTREGGAQPQEYLAKYRAERVRTLGTAWMGMTLGCCECHDHKYDPFSTKDFYSIGAFFDGLRQWGVYADYGYTPNPDLKGFNNDYPFPPEIRVQSPSLRFEIRTLERERDLAFWRDLGASTLASPEYAAWLESLTRLRQAYPDGWVAAPITQAATSHATQLDLLPDGGLLFTGSGDSKETITVTAQVTEPVIASSLRLQVLPDEHNGGFVGRGNNGHFTVQLTASVDALEVDAPENGESNPASEQLPVEIAWAEADRTNPTRYRKGYDPDSLGDVWRSGPTPWQLPSTEAQLMHTAVFHFAEPLELSAGRSLTVKLKSSDIGRVRIAVSAIGQAIPGWPAVSPEIASALQTPASERSELQQATLTSAYYRSTLPLGAQHPSNRMYRERIREKHAGWAMSLVAQSVPDDQIPISRVLPRGNWQDESGEVVTPDFPHFLPKPARLDERRLTRLDLAEWLTSRDNPLTARHFVNHTWKQFFGAGLSAKLDDLGNQGEWPSHPLLLDWLAVEFVESGWDVKHLIRTMVNSRTYRQVAASRRDLLEVDPYNRLLAQQSPRRLEAEIIRDNALAISGLLDIDHIGGPSVFPYQPDGHYANLQFPDRSYTASPDDRQYRRGVYMHWQRTFLHPMLVNFDAPSRDECTADRPQSNSPQQALTLLNDPSFAEAAHVMAARLVSEHADSNFDAWLESAFLRALSRSPSRQERDSLQALFAVQREYFQQNEQEARHFVEIGNRDSIIPGKIADVAALAQVCRVILNLHETITRY